jgi:hypothetical protein
MKTYLLRDLFAGLSDVNKSFVTTLFLGEQFVLDHAIEIAEAPDDYAGQHFVINRHYKQFNHRLGDTSRIIQSLHEFSFKTSYIAAYSQFEAFREELRKWASTLAVAVQVGPQWAAQFLDPEEESASDTFGCDGMS